MVNRVMSTEEAKAAVRDAWSEEQFLREVLRLAKGYGWRSYHARPARCADNTWRTAVQGDGKGFPDLVLVRERIIVAELKAKYGKPSSHQTEWLYALSNAGAEVYTWWPKDWDAIARILEGGKVVRK